MKQFTICIDCRRALVHKDPKTGTETRTKSKYPYCIPCYMRHGEDPNFQKWIVANLARKGLKIT